MIRKGVAAGIAALTLLTSMPASAGSSMGSAEKLRRLDIMLMVTGLRCRTTPDNFTTEYRRFSANHLAELNAAAAELRHQFAASYGPAGADRALDRFSTTMANAYGQGHPWLDCRQLKTVARNLAEVRGAEALAEAADQLIGGEGSAQLAYSHR
jgi:hypothetical protein